MKQSLIQFHYDVEEHYISSDQFIRAINCSKAVLDDVNRYCFNNKLKYQIVVAPPQPGTLLETLIVTGGVAGGAVLGEFTCGYLEGLLGKSVKDIAIDFGKETKDALSERRRIISNILAESAVNFIRKSPKELQKLDTPFLEFRDSLEAKNNFYTSCHLNNKIKGLGFDSSSSFEIKAQNFPKFIMPVPDEPEDDVWLSEISRVTIHSPNWIRSDSRQWKGSEKGTTVFFSIEDETFWYMAKHDQLEISTKDVMEVQWAFQKSSPKSTSKKNIRILRVLFYNGNKISNKMSPEELNGRLDSWRTVDKGQIDLFSL